MLDLGRASWIRTVKTPFTYTEEDVEELWALCPDRPIVRSIYGKKYDTPRLEYLAGNMPYRYAGVTMEPQPVTGRILHECIAYARRAYPGHIWNGALVNFYRDGNDYISAHRDDERDMDKTAPILSFSFGGARTFKITDAKTGKEVVSIPLLNNLVIMGGEMQTHFKHEVPKQKKSKERRINVTVRALVSKKRQRTLST